MGTYIEIHWLKLYTPHAGGLGSIPGSGRSLEGVMAIPSSILAWRTPWTEEPGGLQSIGSQKIGPGKTLESPLDCREIKTVHPKGDPS